jgi:hypothetical protein
MNKKISNIILHCIAMVYTWGTSVELPLSDTLALGSPQYMMLNHRLLIGNAHLDINESQELTFLT